MINVFIVLIILALTAWFFHLPAVKGKCGELLVAYRLNSALDKNVYKVINNVMIPDGNGGSTQIDHIAVSPFGVFVIETKNMKGWIFGDRNSGQWTQQLYKNKHTFQNPFRQNYKHIRCLAELTGLASDKFIHVIVFVGDCTIKTRERLPLALTENATQMLEFIKSFDQPVIADDAVQNICSAILANRIENTFANTRTHIKYVQKIASDKQTDKEPASYSAEKIAEMPDPPIFTEPENSEIPDPPVFISDVAVKTPSCPLCGSSMVQRKARSGANAGKIFWGCERYPECRGIINID